MVCIRVEFSLPSCLYWWFTDCVRDKRCRLLLEQSFCGYPMLCRQHCSPCAFSCCSQLVAWHMLFLCLHLLPTQLVQFSRMCSLDCSPASFLFNSLELRLSHSAKHLGHILSFSLSDIDDIVCVKKDLIHKANYILYSVSSCNPLVKNRLRSSFYLFFFMAQLFGSPPPLN